MILMCLPSNVMRFAPFYATNVFLCVLILNTNEKYFALKFYRIHKLRVIKLNVFFLI